MGIVKTGLAIIAVSLTFSASVYAKDYKAADDSAESELCVAAATASKIRMHSKVADFTPSIMTSKNYKLVANKLYCNGINVVQFAKEAGNFAVAEKLARYRSNYVEIKELAEIREGKVNIGSK